MAGNTIMVAAWSASRPSSHVDGGTRAQADCTATASSRWRRRNRRTGAAAEDDDSAALAVRHGHNAGCGCVGRRCTSCCADTDTPCCSDWWRCNWRGRHRRCGRCRRARQRQRRHHRRVQHAHTRRICRLGRAPSGAHHLQRAERLVLPRYLHQRVQGTAGARQQSGRRRC